MKTSHQNLLSLPTLMIGLGWLMSESVPAQNFTTLYNFSAATSTGSLRTNLDGISPALGDLAGNTLYGTAQGGGTNGYGTIFSIQTNGAGFTNLFTFATVPFVTGPNEGGINPNNDLIVSGGTLYGTAEGGGHAGFGTVFRFDLGGSGLTTLYNLSGVTFPRAGMSLSGNTLYCTASAGGNYTNFPNGYGSVFAVNTDGTGYTNLHNFSGTNDGGTPLSKVIVLYNGALAGTVSSGVGGEAGKVFTVNTNGSGFSILSSLGSAAGSYPIGGLAQGIALYGTTSTGGSGYGTIYAVNSGTLSVLHTFTSTDGANPQADLTLYGNTLYGTTSAGGSGNSGTVFSLNIDGSGFTLLHQFAANPGNAANADGSSPNGRLVLWGNTLFGTTAFGGSNGSGTIFSIALPIQLSAVAGAAGQTILYWPASATNVVIQTSTNFQTGPWTTLSNGMPIMGVAVPNTLPYSYYRIQPQ